MSLLVMLLCGRQAVCVCVTCVCVCVTVCRLCVCLGGGGVVLPSFLFNPTLEKWQKATYGPGYWPGQLRINYRHEAVFLHLYLPNT